MRKNEEVVVEIKEGRAACSIVVVKTKEVSEVSCFDMRLSETLHAKWTRESRRFMPSL